MDQAGPKLLELYLPWVELKTCATEGFLKGCFKIVSNKIVSTVPCIAVLIFIVVCFKILY